MWSKWFLQEQGYEPKKNVFYQDNESTIKMEINGKKSCSDKSRHIHIRYSFIKVVLMIESINVRHFPTERMIADFFTNPLQGALFRKMREIIMGLTTFPIEERVENNGHTSDNDQDRVKSITMKS